MRTRKAFRLPEWATNAIKAVANGYEVTETDALLRIIDQGHKWHLKNISKIKGGKMPQSTLSDVPQVDFNDILDGIKDTKEIPFKVDELWGDTLNPDQMLWVIKQAEKIYIATRTKWQDD